MRIKAKVIRAFCIQVIPCVLYLLHESRGQFYDDFGNNGNGDYGNEFNFAGPNVDGQEEKCPAYKGLIEFPQADNPYPFAQYPQQIPSNCLQDSDCCKDSVCCLSPTEGVTKCYNPVLADFTLTTTQGGCLEVSQAPPNPPIPEVENLGNERNLHSQKSSEEGGDMKAPAPEMPNHQLGNTGSGSRSFGSGFHDDENELIELNNQQTYHAGAQAENHKKKSKQKSAAQRIKLKKEKKAKKGHKILPEGARQAAPIQREQAVSTGGSTTTLSPAQTTSLENLSVQSSSEDGTTPSPESNEAEVSAITASTPQNPKKSTEVTTPAGTEGSVGSISTASTTGSTTKAQETSSQETTLTDKLLSTELMLLNEVEVQTTTEFSVQASNDRSYMPSTTKVPLPVTSNTEDVQGVSPTQSFTTELTGERATSTAVNPTVTSQGVTTSQPALSTTETLAKDESASSTIPPLQHEEARNDQTPASTSNTLNRKTTSNYYEASSTARPGTTTMLPDENAIVAMAEVSTPPVDSVQTVTMETIEEITSIPASPSLEQLLFSSSTLSPPSIPMIEDANPSALASTKTPSEATEFSATTSTGIPSIVTTSQQVTSESARTTSILPTSEEATTSSIKPLFRSTLGSTNTEELSTQNSEPPSKVPSTAATQLEQTSGASARSSGPLTTSIPAITGSVTTTTGRPQLTVTEQPSLEARSSTEVSTRENPHSANSESPDATVKTTPELATEASSQLATTEEPQTGPPPLPGAVMTEINDITNDRTIPALERENSDTAADKHATTTAEEPPLTATEKPSITMPERYSTSSTEKAPTTAAKNAPATAAEKSSEPPTDKPVDTTTGKSVPTTTQKSAIMTQSPELATEKKLPETTVENLPTTTKESIPKTATENITSTKTESTPSPTTNLITTAETLITTTQLPPTSTPQDTEDEEEDTEPTTVTEKRTTSTTTTRRTVRPHVAFHPITTHKTPQLHLVAHPTAPKHYHPPQPPQIPHKPVITPNPHYVSHQLPHPHYSLAAIMKERQEEMQNHGRSRIDDHRPMAVHDKLSHHPRVAIHRPAAAASLPQSPSLESPRLARPPSLPHSPLNRDSLGSPAGSSLGFSSMRRENDQARQAILERFEKKGFGRDRALAASEQQGSPEPTEEPTTEPAARSDQESNSVPGPVPTAINGPANVTTAPNKSAASKPQSAVTAKPPLLRPFDNNRVARLPS